MHERYYEVASMRVEKQLMNYSENRFVTSKSWIKTLSKICILELPHGYLSNAWGLQAWINLLKEANTVWRSKLKELNHPALADAVVYIAHGTWPLILIGHKQKIAYWFLDQASQLQFTEMHYVNRSMRYIWRWINLDEAIKLIGCA